MKMMNEYHIWFDAWRRFLRRALGTGLEKLLPARRAAALAVRLKPTKRYRVNVGHPTALTLILVGTGGTGSFAAHILAQFAVWANEHGLSTRLIFVDPDAVETKNLVRQNFCPAEVGYPKAFCLAWRYSAAFGLAITPLVRRFGSDILDDNAPFFPTPTALTVIVGAVDNAAARRDIAAAIEQRIRLGATIWWIDAGNERDSGQVLAGNSLQPEPQLSPLGYCTALPLPHIQEPGLLAPPPRPVEEETLSCAELGLLGEQSAMINRQMAGWIGVYLYRLFQSRDLDFMATWLDLAGGAARSTPVSDGKMHAPIRRILPAANNTPPTRIPVNNTVDIPPLCPECEEGHLVTGQDDFYGIIIPVRFCDHCTYRVEGCPECWGEISTGTRVDLDGNPVTIAYCTECGWRQDLGGTPPPLPL